MKHASTFGDELRQAFAHADDTYDQDEDEGFDCDDCLCDPCVCGDEDEDDDEDLDDEEDDEE